MGDSNAFALEGTRKNHFYYEYENTAYLGLIKNSSFSASHAFLVLPPEFLVTPHFETNNAISLEEIKKIQINSNSELSTKNKLPLSYKKIAELPANDINFEIEEHHPYGGLMFILPITFAVDVVGFPFEYWLVMSSMGHGC
jgi:hypothetical protein